MKRTAVLFLFLALLAMPAVSQLRLDLGIDVPKGLGAAIEGNAEISTETVDFFNKYFIPFPEASLHYQRDFGILKLGAGARAFTFILETFIWPNVFIELNLDRLAVEAQVGGGLFAMIGIYNNLTSGSLFFPDLSLWYKLGSKRAFRVGAGVLGFYAPELSTDSFVMAFYLGAKVALDL